jgi:hypothetical protein
MEQIIKWWGRGLNGRIEGWNVFRINDQIPVLYLALNTPLIITILWNTLSILVGFRKVDSVSHFLQLANGRGFKVRNQPKLFQFESHFLFLSCDF